MMIMQTKQKKSWLRRSLQIDMYQTITINHLHSIFKICQIENADHFQTTTTKTSKFTKK